MGRAPALIEDLVFRLVDIETLPPKPDYTGASPLVCQRTVPEGVDFEPTTFGPSPETAMKDGNPIRYVAFGRMTYRGLGGKQHHTGWALEVAPVGPFAGPYSNPEYEYYD